MSAAALQEQGTFDRFLRKRRMQSAYRHVFLTLEGRIVLADLAKRCFVLSTTFASGPDGDRISAFQEGQRAVFQHIQTVLRKTDEEIRNLTEEDWT